MNQPVNAIAENFFRVKRSIEDVARACTRSSDAIRLIAVSKGHELDAIKTVIACGQKDFGESTTQEGLKKISQLAIPSIDWHFIGHLQRNKAKYIPVNFSWLHSLDDLDLARALSRHAQQRSANVNTLIEVNVTGDPKKHGMPPADVPRFIEQLLALDLAPLPLRGLMTIGPHGASEKERRACFARLRELRDACQRRYGLSEFIELSMGMSEDYLEAVQEGATLVRVGSAIFGERSYFRK